MFCLPLWIAAAIGPFAPLFSRRVWAHAQVLLVGALLAPAQRTVAAALRATGRADVPQFHRYHWGYLTYTDRVALGGAIGQQQQSLLEGDGGLVGERRVGTLPIVEDLDPFEDRRPCRRARRPLVSGDEFGLEGGEEALGHGVVEALPRAAH